MKTSPRRAMTNSGLAVAKKAVEMAQKALPAYSHRNSPKTYTQHQLFAILAVRQFFGLDYRMMSQLLAEWSDLRAALGLKKVPHYTALQKADVRIVKKTALTACLTPS